MPSYTSKDVAKAVRLVRPDLIHDTEDVDRSHLRLVINAYRFFPGLVKRADVPSWRKRFAAPVINGRYRNVLTLLPYELWSIRSDLQALYDLTDEKNQEGYLWWFFQCGVSEYQLTDFLSPVHDEFLFNCTDVIGPLDDGVVLPRFAHYIWKQREDLQQAFDLETTEGVRGVISWFYQFAFLDPKLCVLLTLERQQFLLAELEVNGVVVPRLAYLLWQGAKSLKKRFPSIDDESFITWWRGESVSAVPLVAYLKGQAEGVNDPGWPYQVVSEAQKKPGVNLVGYAQGESGVSEDVRAAAMAMKSAGIAFSVVNLDPGHAVSTSQEVVLGDYYDMSLPYDTTLFCTTGVEMMTLAAKHGEALFLGTKVIGYWPWELSSWPESWSHAFAFVDELWASSHFIYHALVACSPVPVRLAPMVVSVSSSAGLGRRDFGLSRGVFYFVFTFDFLSMASRKNPMAVIDAFKEAFSKSDRSVGLVIKAMRPGHSLGLWGVILAEAESDPRIILISDTIERGAVLDLYRACNCFVSLHRSEGFGRGIAECMLLGKPVIVTAYSGNLDFTVPGSAGLVGYRLRNLEGDEYPQGERQVWAEPKLDEAIWWMRRVVDDPSVAQQLAASGFQLVSAGFSPEAVGRRYIQLLVDQG